MVADAGGHGRVTGFCTNDRIPQQVLSTVPGSSLKGAVRPDILILEKQDRDNLSLMPKDLQYLQDAQHVVQVGYCMEVGKWEVLRKKCAACRADETPETCI